MGQQVCAVVLLMGPFSLCSKFVFFSLPFSQFVCNIISWIRNERTSIFFLLYSHSVIVIYTHTCFVSMYIWWVCLFCCGRFEPSKRLFDTTGCVWFCGQLVWEIYLKKKEKKRSGFVHLVLSDGARDPSLELRLLFNAAPHLLLRLLWFWECSSQRLVVLHLVQWCLNVLRTSVLRKQKNRVTRNPWIKQGNKQFRFFFLLYCLFHAHFF